MLEVGSIPKSQKFRNLSALAQLGASLGLGSASHGIRAPVELGYPLGSFRWHPRRIGSKPKTPC